MAIVAYQFEVILGKRQTLYMVVAEAINRFSGKRVQKKRRGISSKPRALTIYKELWAICREGKPEEFGFLKWSELVDSYYASLDQNIRSLENPNGFSPQVVRTKKSRLNHLRGWNDRHLALITPQFVTNELDAMERAGVTRSVTHYVQKEVKCIYSYALNLGTIQSNPFAGMRLRKIPKKRKMALTHEEVDRLLGEARNRNHQYFYIWLLTITLGLRRSELAGLKWIDVDFAQHLIYLRRQVQPREGLVEDLKDREERVVAIPDYIIPVLKELQLAGQTDFVIEVDCKDWKMGAQAAVLRAFCREIGIKEVTHHQLRATHITLALIDGVPLGIVKENVGHAKLSTTDEYFRSAGINMRGQTDGLKVRVPQFQSAKVVSFERKG